MNTWKSELRRAIRIAASNRMELVPGAFWTLEQIGSMFGCVAIDEFKTWFVSERVLDINAADKLHQLVKAGKMQPDELGPAITTKCLHWHWKIPLKLHIQAWKIIRDADTTLFDEETK